MKPVVKKLLILGAGIGCLAAAIAGGTAALRRPPEQKLSPFTIPAGAAPQNGQPPVMFSAPSFTAFADQDGNPTSDKQLRGRVWIADFIFTNCAGMCPRVTAQLVAMQKQIDDPDIRFVSFSVDPARDDPKTLKAYSQKNNAGDARWMLLRPPDRKAILHVAQRMAAVSRASSADDTILHTDFLILIDPEGRVRGLYDTQQPQEMERLKAHAMALAHERAMNNADHPTR